MQNQKTRSKRRSVLFQEKFRPKQREQIHVILKKEGWALEKRGASRALRVYKNKDTALQAARIMRKRGYDVVVHERDGAVQKWEHAPA